MQILATVLGLLGLAAGVIALGILIYVLPQAHPKEHTNPDWMTVLLRRYKPHIIAYFILLVVAGTFLALASYVGRHAP